MIIVDTTVWIDYLRGTRTLHVEWLEANLLRERLGLTDLILCEVLQGVTIERTFEAVQRELLTFEICPMGGADLAIEAARNYRRLREAGRTVRRTIDSLIATYCLRERHTLLHNDRDYDPFEELLGLLVLHP
jgi:predicted nucleic acid-binding protein